MLHPQTMLDLRAGGLEGTGLEMSESGDAGGGVDAGFADEVCATAIVEQNESAMQQSLRQRSMQESYHCAEFLPVMCAVC